MRIGIITGAAGEADDLRTTIQKVVQADRDGFDNFWVPQVSSGPGFDALTFLSLAGICEARRVTRCQRSCLAVGYPEPLCILLGL